MGNGERGNVLPQVKEVTMSNKDDDRQETARLVQCVTDARAELVRQLGLAGVAANANDDLQVVENIVSDAIALVRRAESELRTWRAIATA